MAEGSPPPPIRLMNFVSEEQLDEAKRTRGERVDDGSAQRDRPLFEILQENKDKRDAEFNERFKHRPPKALDEEETEFLDKLEMSRKEYERQIADEEAQQLQKFQAAVVAKSMIVHELKEPLHVPRTQETTSLVKKKPAAHPLVITVKPQSKKAKLDTTISAEPPEAAKIPDSKVVQSKDSVKTTKDDPERLSNPSSDDGYLENSSDVMKPGLLVSYTDESDEE